MTWRRSLCFFKSTRALCSNLKMQANNNFGRFSPLSPLAIHEIALNLINPHNNYYILPPPLLDFSDIDSIFNLTTSLKLNQIAHHFINASSLSFFTDGSLKNLGSPTVQMGIAWLQTDPRQLPLTFNASFSLHCPSSCLAELIAIIAALFVSPPNSSIKIFTDSASAISNFQKMEFFLSSSPTLNPTFNQNLSPSHLPKSKHILTILITIK